MAKKKKKMPTDINLLAAEIIKEATKEPSQDEISRIMSAMGRRGGLKGGPSRAKKLSAKKRKAIAKKAAQARWGKKPQP